LTPLTLTSWQTGKSGHRVERTRSSSGVDPVESRFLLKVEIMKTSIIALLLLASGASFANEAGDDAANRTAFAGERTRANVKADTQAAKQSGLLGLTEYGMQQQAAGASQRSRSEARAEAIRAARTRVIHEQI
jgi:hypothetical protein